MIGVKFKDLKIERKIIIPEAIKNKM